MKMKLQNLDHKKLLKERTIVGPRYLFHDRALKNLKINEI